LQIPTGKELDVMLKRCNILFVIPDSDEQLHADRIVPESQYLTERSAKIKSMEE
jgi:hypothetical protein